MKKRFISILSIALMELICFSSCKKADGNPETVTLLSGSNRYISPEELQEIADLIFIGEYIGETGQVIPDAEFLGDTIYYPVYTNHAFKPVKVLKGEAADEVTIRCAGGTLGDYSYSCEDTLVLENGKRYLMYTYEGRPEVPNDTKYNYVITTHCFEIDDSGVVDFSKVTTPEDVSKLQAQYDSAVSANASVTE